MLRFVPIAAALMLAACASPEDRCVRNATPDFRPIDAEIAEAEANIARGYRIRKSGVNVGFDFCNRAGNATLCIGGDRELTSGPIPIDASAERQRLQDLRARRAEMVAQTADAISACRGAG